MATPCALPQFALPGGVNHAPRKVVFGRLFDGGGEAQHAVLAGYG